MTTTYRASFRNPYAQKLAVNSFVGTREKPDTSSDAALAAALAEEEAEAEEERKASSSDMPTSPSGVTMNFPLCFGARPTQQAAGQPHRRLISDGIRHHQQLVQRKSASGSRAGAQPANETSSDAELARRLQDVELKAVADAQDKSPSLLFPDFLKRQSEHERALSATLSRAPSVKVTPAARLSTLLPPEEPEVVSADRQRLLATLALYGLQEREVAGDGNCQFRSLSDQLYGTPDYHDAVRSTVVAQLRNNASSYSCYVLGEYDEYCSSMANSGTWGDHVTLQAAADRFSVPIVVVTSFAESPVINIQPASCLSPRTLYLSFWAEVHYNSLYAARHRTISTC